MSKRTAPPLTDDLIQGGLPANLDAERLVLGVALTDPEAAENLLSVLAADDFSLRKHQLIFTAIRDLRDAGERPDRVTVASKLKDNGQLEVVDGFTYIVSLDDGLPEIFNIDGYVQIVKEKAARRRLICALQTITDRALSPGENLDELLAEAEESLRGVVSSRQHKRHLRTFSEFLAEHGYDAFASARRCQPTIPVPWSRLANILGGGLRPQELVIVGGRPSHGKSAVAAQLAYHAAAAGKSVLLFSLEMGADEIWYRIIAAAGEVPLQLWRKGRLSGADRGKVQRTMTDVSEMPLWVDDQANNCTTTAIRTAVRRYLSQGREADLIIVDYLQLMTTVKRTDSRVQEVSEISRSLKLLAKEFSCPVVALSQVTRYPEEAKQPPCLRMLRESGSLEQDADVVIFVWANAEERERAVREKRACRTLIKVAKQRNGPIGNVEVFFSPQHLRFDDGLEEGHPENGGII